MAATEGEDGVADLLHNLLDYRRRSPCTTFWSLFSMLHQILGVVAQYTNVKHCSSHIAPLFLNPLRLIRTAVVSVHDIAPLFSFVQYYSHVRGHKSYKQSCHMSYDRD